MSHDSSSIKIEVYNNGETVRLLKLVFFTYKGAGILQTSIYTSVMIYHCGASLSEQHNDLLCTKQDLSHTSRYVDESSTDSQVSHTFARYVDESSTDSQVSHTYARYVDESSTDSQVSHTYARTPTLSVTTYA